MRRSALYPNASAPIRAMAMSAGFSLASGRRFAIWTSSAILVPFGGRVHVLEQQAEPDPLRLPRMDRARLLARRRADRKLRRDTGPVQGHPHRPRRRADLLARPGCREAGALRGPRPA